MLQASCWQEGPSCRRVPCLLLQPPFHLREEASAGTITVITASKQPDGQSNPLDASRRGPTDPAPICASGARQTHQSCHPSAMLTCADRIQHSDGQGGAVRGSCGSLECACACGCWVSTTQAGGSLGWCRCLEAAGFGCCGCRVLHEVLLRLSSGLRSRSSSNISSVIMRFENKSLSAAVLEKALATITHTCTPQMACHTVPRRQVQD